MRVRVTPRASPTRIEADQQARRPPRTKQAANSDQCGGSLCQDSLQSVGWSDTVIADRHPRWENEDWGRWTAVMGLRVRSWPVLLPNQEGGFPAPGWQVYNRTFTHSIDIYLENATNPLGDYQVVNYQSSHSVTPAKDNRFFQMLNPFETTITYIGDPTGGRLYWERAWWTGLLVTGVTPSPTATANLVPHPSAVRRPAAAAGDLTADA